MNPIFVFTTGGTIEKTYSEFDGSLRNRNSMLKKRLLSRLRLPHLKVELIEVMAKDSLDMVDEDREAIFKSVSNRFEQGVPSIVLHGTDTMAQTIEYFYKRNPSPPVPIVFTGAMKPMGFEDSDAMQNFTEALMAVQVLQPGIYLSFHSHLFEAPNLRKNKKRRTFEKVTG